MKPRILITGASGYLGGNLVLQHSSEFELLAMYHTRRPTEDYGARWFVGDLLDESLPIRLMNDIRPNVIIHNAALSKPDDCEVNPDLARELNIEATDRIATAANKCFAKVIFLSTDIVYDGEHAPYSEDISPAPICLYGTTKLLGEAKVMSRSERNLVLRTAVMYGAAGIFGSNFALTMIDKWKRGETAPVFIDQIRSHVSVRWLVKVIYDFALKEVSGVYNIGGAEPTSRADFAYLLASQLGYPDSLLTETSFIGKLQGPRPRDVTLALTKAKAILRKDLQPLTLTQGFALEW